MCSTAILVNVYGSKIFLMYEYIKEIEIKNNNKENAHLYNNHLIVLQK